MPQLQPQNNIRTVANRFRVPTSFYVLGFSELEIFAPSHSLHPICIVVDTNTIFKAFLKHFALQAESSRQRNHVVSPGT